MFEYRASVMDDALFRNGVLASSALFAWNAVAGSPDPCFCVALCIAHPCEPCFVEGDLGSDSML